MVAADRGPAPRPALSRCVGVPAQRFADDYWGRTVLLSPSSDLPSGFDDLFTADAVVPLAVRTAVGGPFAGTGRAVGTAVVAARVRAAVGRALA